MTRRDYLIIWINSTVFFLLAYLIVYSMIGVATILSAYAFEISSELFYSHIAYYIRSYDWTSDAVKVIFSTGPMLALLMGILLWILYIHVSEETGILKLLILWKVVHCIVFFFGDMMMGALFSQGFGYVIMYLYFMDTGKMIITLVALVAMFSLGLFMGRQFLYTANTYVNAMPAGGARMFALFQYLVPFLTGNIIIMLMKVPGITMFDIFLNLSVVVFLIPVYIRSAMMQDLFFDEEEKSIGIYWAYLGFTVFSMISFRVIHGFGLPF